MKVYTHKLGIISPKTVVALKFRNISKGTKTRKKKDFYLSESFN